jgi:NTP pyrophosphatase (non-canonical NTP hydrolase)
MKTIDLSRYQKEQKEWSEYNFPNRNPRDPMEGLIEELGELSHSRLKARQGIRGTPEEHSEAEQDAIADMMIYLLDFANQSKHQIHPSDFDSGSLTTRSADNYFLQLASRVGDLAYSFRWGLKDKVRQGIDKVAFDICRYAELRKWDAIDLLDAVWSDVKQRDWRRFPKTGRPAEGEVA